jgi:hypothetical protein
VLLLGQQHLRVAGLRGRSVLGVSTQPNEVKWFWPGGKEVHLCAMHFSLVAMVTASVQYGC